MSPKKAQPKKNSKNDDITSGKLDADANQIFIFATIPPDGGFAWVILIVAFLCIAVVDGMIMTVGLLFPKAIRDTNITQFQATVCAAFQSATYYFVGPFICAIANTYGLRTPAVIGGVTAALGLLLSAFSYGFEMIFLTYGLIVGTGFGLIFSPTILIVPTYFRKYRVLASGICSAGTGFGTVSVSFLNEYVFRNVNWRSIMIGQSIICLLLTVLTLLYRPVKPTRIGIAEPTQFARLGISNSNSTFSSVEINIITFEQTNSDSYITLSTQISNISRYRSGKNKFNIIEWCYDKCFEKCFTKNKSSENIQENSYVIKNRPLFRDDVFSTALLPKDKNKKFQYNISDHLSAIETMKLNEKRLTSPDETLATTKKYSTFERILMSVFRLSPIVIEGLEILFDMSIYNYRSFRIFLLSTLFLSLGMKATYLYITQRAILHKIPYINAWWLLPSTGIANTVFRITSSVIQYLFDIEPSLLSSIPLLICGLVNIISGFTLQDNVIFTTILAVVHGGGTSFFHALRGAMVARFFTSDNLRASFGHHMIVTGIGQLVGLILCGRLMHINENFDMPIIYGGTCIVISSILLWTVQFSNARDKEAIK